MSNTIRRRRFFRTLAAAPAATALLAQQAQQAPPPGVPAEPAPGVPLNPAQPVQPSPRQINELPKIDVTSPDAAAAPVPRFFSSVQFSALQKLSGILMPSAPGSAGAIDAKTPEFLDFWISKSPSDRQQTYRVGLDALNSQANKRFKKTFGDLDATQAAALLEPLQAPWSAELPADPLARLLHAAKKDVRTATVNSLEYSTVASAGTSRRGGAATGLYWFPLD